MMSRPLGAKVHYHHNPLMVISKSPCNTASTRSSWYDDDDDDDNNNIDDDDKNDDLSLSSYSLSVTRENATAPCWGGWLLKWTTHRPKPSQQQQQQQQLQLLQRVIRKSSLKVVVSSSSTTSDDSEIDHDDEESCGNNSRCLTPPCPPIVSFPNGRDHDHDDEEEVALGCGDEMHLIRSLEIDGDRFEQEGLLFEAWNVYQRLLELLRATGQSANRIGNVHYRTGMIQYKRNCINEALCHFDQALFIYQLNYNPDDNNGCHENHQDDDSESEEPYDADTDMALDFYRVYVATGHVHLTNQNPYRAIEYFQRALPFVVVTPEPNTTDAVTATAVAVSKQQRSRRHDTYDRYYVQVLHALGTAYEAIGDDTEAQLQYQKAAAVLRT